MKGWIIATGLRRISWYAFCASLMVQVATAVDAAELSQAQDDASTTTAFLDFGIPCEDPLPEADSSKPDGPQVTPKSDPARPLSPANYPPLSRRMGEEGTAVVRLLIADSGKVSQAEIVESTGSPRLDAAALEGTRSWHLQPGTLEGEPRCMWGKFAVSFVLTSYTDSELSQVAVSPEARELARRLFGMERLKEGLLSVEGGLTTVERHIVDATVQGAARSKELLAAEDKIARVVAFEFSTTELVELNQFFASPVAAKWISLDFKMMPAVMAEQLLVGQTVLCSVDIVDQAMQSKDLSDVVVDGKVTERYRQTIPQLADAAIPFCNCLITARQKKNVPQHCGQPPSF